MFRVGTHQTLYVCPTKNTPLCSFFESNKTIFIIQYTIYTYVYLRVNVLMCYKCQKFVYYDLNFITFVEKQHNKKKYSRNND